MTKVYPPVEWAQLPEYDFGVLLTQEQTDIGYTEFWYLLFRYRETGQIVAAPAIAVDFITTTGTGTYTSKPWWNNSSNSVQILGAGGAGAHGASTSTGGGGGAGGNYNKLTNFIFATPGTTTAQYGVGAGGLAASTFPQNGGDTWFNSAAYPTTGTAVGAKGGQSPATNTTATGGTAVAITSNYPASTGFKGGDAAAGTSATAGGGGGGTAGPNGAGGTASGTTGGTADNNTVTGGAAGNPGTSNSGKEFDATHGCGSGGGGSNASGGTGGNGGLYGGGAGGGSRSNGTGGNGANGIIVLTSELPHHPFTLEIPVGSRADSLSRHSPDLRTWIQSPSFATPVTYLPARVTDWGMWTDARVALTWIDTPPISTGALPAQNYIPDSVVDWGMWDDPRVALTWTQGPPPPATGALPPVMIPSRVMDWGIAGQYVATVFKPWSISPNIVIEAAGQPVTVFKPGQADTTVDILPARQAITWTQRPPLTAPVVQKPVSQTDWPLPKAAAWPMSLSFWAQDPPLPFPGKPVVPNDWPLPKAGAQGVPFWSQKPPGPVVAPPPKPVNQADWPVPAQRAQPPRTWTQSPIFATPVASPSLIPSRVVDWGEMWQQPRKALTFVRGVAGVETVVVTPTFMPGRVTDWGEMWQTPRRALTFVRGVAGVALPQKPVNQADWPLPQRAVPFVPAPTPTTVALRVTSIPKPINQFDWPLPVRAAQPVQTWTQEQVPLTPVAPPSKPVVNLDWQVPAQRPPFAPAPLPITVGLRVVSIPKPVNQADWPLPIRPQPLAQAVTQITAPPPPPQVVTLFKPGQMDTTIDVLPARQAITWTWTPPFAAPVSLMPVNQDDWQLPAQRPPFTPAPLPITVGLRVSALLKPVNQSDWPIPIRAAQPVQTWTQEQLPLVTVAPPQKPVANLDWPLPGRSQPLVQAVTQITSPPPPPSPSVTYKPGQVDTTIDVLPAAPFAPAPLPTTVALRTTALPKPVNQADWPIPQRAGPFTAAPLPTTVALRVSSIPKPVSSYDGALPIRVPAFVQVALANGTALQSPPPGPMPLNQDDWPVPIAAPRLANYGYVFAQYTGRMSPPNMPPRTGVFSPPIGPQYPVDLRFFGQAPFHGVGPSATSTGFLHDIPFIATMGAMTAR